MEELISEELESRYYGTTSVLKTVDEIFVDLKQIWELGSKQ